MEAKEVWLNKVERRRGRVESKGSRAGSREVFFFSVFTFLFERTFRVSRF